MAIAVAPVRYFGQSSTPVKSDAARQDILEVWKAYKADPDSTALRNRLVHAYDTIDDARVHGMLPGACRTLRAFTGALANYLEKAEPG